MGIVFETQGEVNRITSELSTRNNEARDKIAETLISMNIDFEDLSRFEQLQLIKFHNGSNTKDRFELLEVIKEADGNRDIVEDYIAKRRKERFVGCVNQLESTNYRETTDLDQIFKESMGKEVENRIITKRNSEKILLKSIQTLNNKIIGCEVDFVQNKFIVIFTIRDNESNYSISCAMSDLENGINFTSFKSENDIAHDFKQYESLGMLVQEYFHTYGKVRAIHVAEQKQDNEILWLEYENDIGGKGESSYQIKPKEEKGNYFVRNVNAPGFAKVEGTKFIYQTQDGYISHNDCGIDVYERFQQYIIGPNNLEIVLNEVPGRIDFFDPENEIRINTNYDTTFATLEYAPADSDFIITKDPEKPNKAYYKHKLVYLVDSEQRFSILVDGHGYRLITKNNKGIPWFNGNFTKLSDCINFACSIVDSISNHRYQIHENNGDVKVIIHSGNRSLQAKESDKYKVIELANSSGYSIYENMDKRDLYNDLPGIVTAQPYICLYIEKDKNSDTRKPLILSFDGTMHAKDSNGKWTIINGNEKSDKNNLKIYINSLSK